MVFLPNTKIPQMLLKSKSQKQSKWLDSDWPRANGSSTRSDSLLSSFRDPSWFPPEAGPEGWAWASLLQHACGLSERTNPKWSTMFPQNVSTFKLCIQMLSLGQTARTHLVWRGSALDLPQHGEDLTMSLILEPPKSMAQEIAYKHIQCMHYIRTGCSCVGWANPDIPPKMSAPKSKSQTSEIISDTSLERLLQS
jgi:hypothetical protein